MTGRSAPNVEPVPSTRKHFPLRILAHCRKGCGASASKQNWKQSRVRTGVRSVTVKAVHNGGYGSSPPNRNRPTDGARAGASLMAVIARLNYPDRAFFPHDLADVMRPNDYRNHACR